MDAALTRWREATGEQSWGVQRVLLDTLNLVKDEKIHLVHGADYRDGKSCLINAVASMLTTSNKGVSPSAFAGDLVSAFDHVNRSLADQSINDASGYVSSLAAEILIRNFGPLKTVAEVEAPKTEDAPYIEPSDEALAASWLRSMEAPPVEALDDLVELGDPAAQHLKGLIGN